MRDYTTGRIGKGKAIHAVYASAGTMFAVCAYNHNDDNTSIPVAVDAPAVTCKKCLKAIAAQVAIDYDRALVENVKRESAQVAIKFQQDRADNMARILDEDWTEALRENGMRTRALWATPKSKAARRAVRRQLRATERARRPQTAAAAQARRALRTTAAQPASVLLVAAGLPHDVAKRYAPAFSNKAVCTSTRTARIRSGAHSSKRVDVKLYNRHDFNARLACYRPRNPHAARLFDKLAI